MTGLVVGRLKVIESRGAAPCRQISWLCQCECGNTTVVLGGHLRRGATQSCGCLKSDVLSAIHAKQKANANPEAAKTKKQVWTQKNAARTYAKKVSRFAANPALAARNRALARRNCAKATDELADSYVRKLLSKQLGLGCQYLPPEVVSLKRESIAIKRALKQLNEAIETTNTGNVNDY